MAGRCLHWSNDVWHRRDVYETPASLGGHVACESMSRVAPGKVSLTTVPLPGRE